MTESQREILEAEYLGNDDAFGFLETLQTIEQLEIAETDDIQPLAIYFGEVIA